MDVLQKSEAVRLDRMFAHGGLFKTEGVAQGLLAAAPRTPVAVGDVAAEGGAWGIAVLAAFLRRREPGQQLADYLTTSVFADAKLWTAEPDPIDMAGFDAFMKRFTAAIRWSRPPSGTADRSPRRHRAPRRGLPRAAALLADGPGLRSRQGVNGPAPASGAEGPRGPGRAQVRASAQAAESVTW
jgi:hypothetical protein